MSQKKLFQNIIQKKKKKLKREEKETRNIGL